MEEERKEDKLGCFPYVLGGLSFIPLIGILFGIIVIIWGIIKIKQKGWRLILLGVCGILLTVILYGTLFYVGFIKRGGMYDELRTKMAEPMLTDLVKKIEYYKIQTGRYPKTLEELAPQDQTPPESFIMIYDPTQIDFKTKKPRLYYYELINNGDNYYLLSVGVDGVPFSDDDIYPVVSQEEMKKIGYRKKLN